MLFFCYRNANIRYTKCPISTRPVKKKKNSCMLRMPMFSLKSQKIQNKLV